MKALRTPLITAALILAFAVGIAAALPSPLVKQDPGEGCWQADCWGKLVVEGGEATLVCVNRTCVPATNCKKWPYTGWEYCQCGPGENVYCAFGKENGTSNYECRGVCLDTALLCCKKNIMGGLAQCCKCVAPSTEGVCPAP